MSSTAVTMEKLEVEGDPSSMRVRWERWKRSLAAYLEACNIQSNERKRAHLIHHGGPALQEIFENLPGARVEADPTDPYDNVDVFEVALSKLDEYFAPKQNSAFERHLFRSITQDKDESFDKFLVRLRLQAERCDFADKETSIIDQIIEKCKMTELRKKILQDSENTLDRVIEQAHILEALNKQMGQYEEKPKETNNESESVNKINFKPKNKFNNKRRFKDNRDGCTRCGNPKHSSQSPECPAKTKNCLKCGFLGHFRQYCKTKANKRKINDNQDEAAGSSQKTRRFNDKNEQVNQLTTIESEERVHTNYVFHIDDDEEIECEIGGVKTNMLIDSGCKHNLLTSETWESLKNSKVKVQNQENHTDIKFTAYGSDKPLKVKGSLEAKIKIGGRYLISKFYVIENGTRNLLGKTTAIELGILKIGLDMDINQIESHRFPKFKNVLIELPINESVTPISQPYRRVPIPLEEKIEAKIEELAERDIIEEVKGSSAWVSPLVPILKDNGEVRLCVDMRRANEAITRENHPLPTMDKLLPKIKDAKYFSKLDIKDAFHQIEIHPDSRHITTFITSKGLYRYKRMMFGISCAPEIFQKTLEKILINCKGAINFIDDILIYGKDLAEHDRRLKQVMDVLKKNNVVLRMEKCQFRTQEVSFLGHELTRDGVKPLQKYVSTIRDFRAPNTKAELQSFLGLVNYVSKWIPNYATITEPLKCILRKDKTTTTGDLKNLWGEQQKEAFEQLKLALTSIQTLGYYDVKDRTIVVADASPVGLGSVLIQADEKGPRVIAYGHKTLTDVERRYCQTEKEALALVWAVEHFHMFLYGKEFELVTDHKPLEVIFGPKSKPCARIERWILRMQNYKYKVIYKPGKSNIADPISRLCTTLRPTPTSEDHYVHHVVECTTPVAVSTREIAQCSNEDEEIQKVRKGIYDNKWDKDIKSYQIFETELCFHEGILLRGTRIVIPKRLREKVLAAAHEGHPGIAAMKARLRTKVWWPKCDKDAEDVVRSCKGCTLVSLPNPPNPMKRRELPDEPWIDIAIDLMGPLPSGEYLFVVVDYFSRYKEIKICRQITASEIVRLLKEIFSRVGNPDTITADNGRQFISEEFKKFCSERNITIFNTIPYWPQQNGEVERQNRDILKRLKISQVEGNDWKEALLEYLTMYNSTPHSTTGLTPSELFYNRKFKDKLPMLRERNPKLINTEFRDRDRQMKEKGRERADRKRKAMEPDLGPGDKVYVKNQTKTNKLSLNYRQEPHTVEKIVGGDVQVRNDQTGETLRRNIVHLKRVQGQWKVVNDEVRETVEEDRLESD